MAKKIENNDQIIEAYRKEINILSKSIGELNQDKYDLKVECDIWRLRWDSLKRDLIDVENSDYMDNEYRETASSFLKKMEAMESRWT